MIRTIGATFLVYFVCSLFGISEAACLRQTYTSPNDDMFKYSYLCTSSFEYPSYDISRVITDDIDVQIFNFDPNGDGGTCYSIEWNALNEQFCFTISLSEALVYQSKYGHFEIRPNSDYDSFLATIQSNEVIFSHPVSAGLTSYPCNIYLLDGGDVFVFSDEGLQAISECLLRMEIFLTENPESLLSFYR
jgi:hypothetical protein